MEFLRQLENEEYRYDLQATAAYVPLAVRLCMREEKVIAFIKDLIEYNILKTDGRYIWSEGLRERMKTYEAKKKILSESGKRGTAIKKAKKQAQQQNQSHP